MKKMMKAFAVLAAIAMLGSSFVGCKTDDDDDEKPKSTPTVPGGNGGGETGGNTQKSTITKADKVLTFEFDTDVTLGTGSVKIYSGDTLIDTVNSADESFTSGNNNNSIGTINCGNQLIQAEGKKVIVITHTDANAYSKLLPSTTYKAVFDAALVGAAANVEKTCTTISAKEITGTTISVGPAGDFKTIQGALDLIREKNSTDSWTINVAEGTYLERLYYKGDANLRIEGPEAEFGSKVKILWDNGNYRYTADAGARGRAAHFFNGKCNLVLKNISMENTSTKFADNQAEALTFDSSGNLVAYNCSFKSHQDTHYIGAKGCRAWFYKCHIEGDVDFLWGYADVVLYEECEMVALNNGKGTPQAVLIAARGDINQPANKGFVLLNNKIRVVDGVQLAFARNSGADTNGAFIDNVFTLEGSGSIDPAIYRAVTNNQMYDANDEMAIGWKDCGSKYADGTDVDTSARLEKCGAISNRLKNREYSGRHVILNRGYNVATGVYKAATTWDISAYEAEFKATADTSKDNVYVEPVAVKNVLTGKDTPQFTASVAGGTWKVEEEVPGTIVKSIVNGLVTTNAGTKGTVKVIYTAPNGKTDCAYIYTVEKFEKATKIVINDLVEAMDLGKTVEVTSKATNDKDEDATLEEVTWTTSDDKVLAFIDTNDGYQKKSSVTVARKDAKVTVWALGTGTAKLTATHVDGVTVDSAVVTVTDKITEWSSLVSGVVVNTDVQSKAINIYDGMIIDTTAGGKCGMKNSSIDRNQCRQLTLFVPVKKDCDIIIDMTSAAIAGVNGLDADGEKVIYTGRDGSVELPEGQEDNGPWQYKICVDYDTQAVDYATATANITDAVKADLKKWVAGCDEKLAAIPTDTKFFPIVFPYTKDVYWKTLTRVYDDSISYDWVKKDITVAFEDKSDLILDLYPEAGKLTATRAGIATGADAAEAQISYVSDNPAVATVDATGTVTAVAKGFANISVKEAVMGTKDTYAVQVVDTTPKASANYFVAITKDAEYTDGKMKVVVSGSNANDHGAEVKETGATSVIISLPAGTYDLLAGTCKYGSNDKDYVLTCPNSDFVAELVDAFDFTEENCYKLPRENLLGDLYRVSSASDMEITLNSDGVKEYLPFIKADKVIEYFVEITKDATYSDDKMTVVVSGSNANDHGAEVKETGATSVKISLPAGAYQLLAGTCKYGSNDKDYVLTCSNSDFVSVLVDGYDFTEENCYKVPRTNLLGDIYVVYSASDMEITLNSDGVKEYLPFIKAVPTDAYFAEITKDATYTDDKMTVVVSGSNANDHGAEVKETGATSVKISLPAGEYGLIAGTCKYGSNDKDYVLTCSNSDFVAQLVDAYDFTEENCYKVPRTNILGDTYVVASDSDMEITLNSDGVKEYLPFILAVKL